MTRIIAGSARGRRLAVPPRGTRPTTDRVREALFSALGAELGSWSGLRVADLFAGSGALGLEALSRGAAHALLVERDRRAVAVLRANVLVVARAGAEVVGRDVRVVLADPPQAPYEVVLADPPYDLPATGLTDVLRSLTAHDWLTEGALVVLERGRDGEPEWPEGYRPRWRREYGDTVLHLASYHRA